MLPFPNYDRKPMNTLITPLQALKLAFGDGEYLPPSTFTEAQIAAAEERHLVPVVGRALHERLLAGACPELVADHLAAPLALFVRLAAQPRLDIRTDRTGTAAPYTASGRPADAEARRRAMRSLRTEARALLRRAAAHIAARPDLYPEYDPSRDILNRCSTDGDLVQIR